MDWTDEAIVLAAKRHGESSAVVSLMTRGHGRHAGLVRGGAGPRLSGVYQPGNEVQARWRARLSEHLGTFVCEPVRLRTAELFDDAARLSAASSACALLEGALPERQPHPRIFTGLSALLDAVERSRSWPARYVAWELELLAELGFGLDLSACAATGAKDDLAYVSPKTGRAVSADAGAPYRKGLLRLPGFLLAPDPASEPEGVPAGEIVKGLELTGYFLARHVFAAQDRPLPAARERLFERFTRLDPSSCSIQPKHD